MPVLDTEPPPARVVVADDSALMRQIVSASLTRAGIRVVGSAADGDQALAVCERERPDALMLDLTMPGLDGIGVLKRLQASAPQLPVVVVSAFFPSQGARAVDALAEGAFDLVPKPAAGEGLDGFATQLVEKVKAATSGLLGGRAGAGERVHRGRLRGASLRTEHARAVIIATSTGGPRALAELVPRLPDHLGVGTLIVQHMPPNFTRSLAARLDQASALTVQEAVGGEILDPRVALLAPGGRHLRLDDSGRTQLSDEPEIGALRPRADLTIADVARVFGERTLLVVLTGMGEDGLLGAGAVKRHGGRVLVQEQESCTVYGMPRAVVEADLADEVLSLTELVDAIREEAR
ncbi:chemotaxis-specific protein-glutamate methyltransferase CheB [Conexibacter sp. DBS9H8]|uniref:chemotaxis-specific protein-glutamate methyltransferase CheB n=1 Tax=Conexibacter sp. DBS9H8 TaxID=2937801 RepID=UPI00200C4B26|nr:chemotaxis-specific protein-glutamate methyltransferase CheB [Conexibacter sp. DBS9H8]